MTFHPLEPRLLLALNVGIVNGQLVVTGTDAGDTITLNQAKGILSVVIQPATFTVPSKGLKGILVKAMLGDDRVTVAETVGLKTTLIGGDGNDLLIGGRKATKLSGDGGHDTLSSGQAPDVFAGGPGIDIVDYSNRTEPVHASLDGLANDGRAPSSQRKGEKDNLNVDIENLIGGQSNDTLVGSPNKNTLKGGFGHDILQGLGGDDLLVGGPGNDKLDGGDGDDFLLAIDSSPLDVLDGGLGFDSAAYDSIVTSPDTLTNIEDHASVFTLGA